MLSRRRIACFALCLTLAVAACGDGEPEGEEASTSTSDTTTTTQTTAGGDPTTTSRPAAPPTTAFGGGFDGSTTPTSAAAPAGLGVALLTDVSVSADGSTDRIRFSFSNGVPGFDAGYVEPPIRADGSGEVVAVSGSAFLEIRLAPASGVDLGGTLEPTYTGPGTVTGDGQVVTEVVRTGDFEANLTWVAGTSSPVPFRVETDPSARTVTVVLDASA